MAKPVVVAILSGNAELSSTIGGDNRIFPQEAPKNAKYPYIVYSRIATAKDRCQQSRVHGTTTETFEIVAVARSDVEAEAIGAKIWNAFETADLSSPVAGFLVSVAVPTDRSDNPETPIYRDDKPTFVDSITVEIAYEVS